MAQAAWPAWARASEIVDLLKLSGPIAVSRMAMMLMSITDAIVLGQYAPGELPFILNSWLPMGICLGFGMGILIGVQVMTSELMGVSEDEQSGRIIRRGLWHSVVMGGLMFVLVFALAGPLFHWIFVELAPSSEMSATLAPEEIASETASATRILSLALPGFMLASAASYYLEALRRPLIVTVVSYLGVAINLAIDLALVGGWFGMPSMGADGVAWATTGSRWAITIVLLVAVIWLTPALKPSRPGPNDEPVRQLSVGGGAAVSNVAEWGGFNLTFIIATWVSLAANSVYGYAVQIMGVVFMLYLGIGTATSVRVAEAFGRGDMAQARDAGRLGVAATILVGVVTGSLMILFREPISRLLVDAEAMIDGVLLAPAIAALLVYAAIGTIFDGLQATASMALRAQDVVWTPSAIHIGSFFLVMIPAGYWLGITEGRGAQGMMEAAVLGVFIAGFLQTVLLELKTARFRRNAPSIS